MFTNKQEFDVLKSIISEPYINQRSLSELSGHSLGVVNKCIKSLIEKGFLNEDIRPTKKGFI
jgi:DNA-binding MarR family transcriptional regulator